ncbi:MAG: class I SAM-dependent methyltransferase [Candidatus Micrarchaeota archaeon]
MRILDLGCGNSKFEGRKGDIVVGLDRVKTPATDVVFNIASSKKFPFKSGQFDVVYSNHVLEHLDDVLFVMDEIHRILKGNGQLIINTPHFSSSDFYADPTHKHPFSSQSFDYFDPSKQLGKSFDFYSNAKFRIIKKRILFVWPPYELLFGWFANRFPGFYEAKMAFIFPAASLHFELECMKK